MKHRNNKTLKHNADAEKTEDSKEKDANNAPETDEEKPPSPPPQDTPSTEG